MGHPEHGLEIMRRFSEALSEVANIEKPAKLEGRNMLMFLAAKPVVNTKQDKNKEDIPNA